MPNLGGLEVGSAAGTTLTALATKADGAIVNSSGTFFTFAGGRALAIPTPAELTRIQKANPAAVLTGAVTSAGTSAAIASGVLLSVSPTAYVTYDGDAYPFKTVAQLANAAYGGTAAVPTGHTGGLPVIPYSGSYSSGRSCRLPLEQGVPEAQYRTRGQLHRVLADHLGRATRVAAPPRTRERAGPRQGFLGARCAQGCGDVVDCRLLGLAHDLTVLTMGGHDFVGQGDDEPTVLVYLDRRGLAL